MQAEPLTTNPPEERVRSYLQRVDRALDELLPAVDQPPCTLHEAMRYSVLGAGKRMRPLLCYAAAESVLLTADRVDSAACAVEFIHAYSLIHDDLPAMDDDDLRRGRPTCHRAFNEATAILAGDALQALAFEALTRDRALSPDTAVSLLRRLALACGSVGMAGGQAIDLEAVGRQLERGALENMHDLKTGALIRYALEAPGVIAAGENGDHVRILGQFGQLLGLAFQIWDDVLDVEGETENLGKPQGSDEQAQKPTFTTCIGIEACKRLTRDLLQQSLSLLDHLPGPTDLLEYLARFTVERNR